MGSFRTGSHSLSCGGDRDLCYWLASHVRSFNRTGCRSRVTAFVMIFWLGCTGPDSFWSS